MYLVYTLNINIYIYALRLVKLFLSLIRNQMTNEDGRLYAPTECNLSPVLPEPAEQNLASWLGPVEPAVILKKINKINPENASEVLIRLLRLIRTKIPHVTFDPYKTQSNSPWDPGAGIGPSGTNWTGTSRTSPVCWFKGQLDASQSGGSILLPW